MAITFFICELHRILFGQKIFSEFSSNVPEVFIRLPKKLASHVSEVVHEGMGACYVVVIQKCFSAVQLKCEGGCRLPGSSGEIERVICRQLKLVTWQQV